MKKLKIQDPVKPKLKRIEGQVRGILGMVEEGRYCIDILTQISAVHAALRRVEKDILKNHVGCCVKGAFKNGNLKEQQKKIDELAMVLAELNR
jgi:CsoR family transcriptional regulator, copper-sensing transcriptional repressor